MSYIHLLYFLVYGKVVVCHFHDKDILMIFSLILNMEVVLYVYDKPTNADIYISMLNHILLVFFTVMFQSFI